MNIIRFRSEKLQSWKLQSTQFKLHRKLKTRSINSICTQRWHKSMHNICKRLILKIPPKSPATFKQGLPSFKFWDKISEICAKVVFLFLFILIKMLGRGDFRTFCRNFFSCRNRRNWGFWDKNPKTWPKIPCSIYFHWNSIKPHQQHLLHQNIVTWTHIAHKL